MRGTRSQPCENTDLRFKHRGLKFGRAGERGKHHVNFVRRGAGAVGLYRTLCTQCCGGIWAAVID